MKRNLIVLFLALIALNNVGCSNVQEFVLVENFQTPKACSIEVIDRTATGRLDTGLGVYYEPHPLMRETIQLELCENDKIKGALKERQVEFYLTGVRASFHRVDFNTADYVGEIEGFIKVKNHGDPDFRRVEIRGQEKLTDENYAWSYWARLQRFYRNLFIALSKRFAKESELILTTAGEMSRQKER